MPSMSLFQMSGLLMTSVSTFAIKMLAKDTAIFVPNARIVSFATLVFSIKFKKYVVSLRYDLCI